MTLVLVDEDESALDLMTRLARRIRDHAGSDVQIESATDRRQALPGASYVITAVARRRYELWEQDFRVPLAHGFRHVLGENGGPGALFHGLRSLNLIIPICRDIEKLAPDALLLNFTNPEARVLQGILGLSAVRAAGLCHGVFGAEGAIRRYLEAGPEDLEIVSAGMNHFYCIQKVIDKRTGEDRTQEAVDKALADEGMRKSSPLFAKMVEVFGVFTFPSDDHIGEYLAFGAEFSGAKWPYGIESRPVRAKEPPRATAPPLEEYADGTRPLDEGILASSGEIAVPVICDIELDRGSRRSAVNVMNSEGYIENLPRDVVVEVPATVDAGGIHPLPVGAIPETYAAYMRTQFSINKLVVEAYRTGSKRLLLQALLLDPCVNSITAAEAMLDEMLDLQKDFLPELA